MGIADTLDVLDSPMDMAGAARLFGVKLASLEEFVRRSVEGVKV